ncbi:hypothetical protein [Duffyella gerundensis]
MSPRNGEVLEENNDKNINLIRNFGQDKLYVLPNPQGESTVRFFYRG